MKKIISIILLCVSANISVVAQLTSLTIDNQAPGWLGSKIGYEDQRTLENLKVTGYINTEDLKFISSLASKYSLHGRLDLEEANIVGDTPDKDNFFISLREVFGVYRLNPIRLNYFSYPNTLAGGESNAFVQLSVDTLFINTTTGFTSVLRAEVKHIRIGDNVSVLQYPSFLDDIGEYNCSIESIEFPSTLREISLYGNRSCEIKNGKNLREFPSLEKLNGKFYVEEMPDSVFLPKIKSFSLGQHPYNSNDNHYDGRKMFKAGMHVFIGEQIDTIGGMDYAEDINLHFSSAKPPVMRKYGGSEPYNKSYHLYVPMGSASAYRACFQEGGTKVIIVEEVTDVTSVELDKHDLTMNVGDKQSLSAVVSPDKATYKTVSWTSDNTDVAEVNNRGVVTAKKTGKAKIMVSSTQYPEIKDSCMITVCQPAQSIELNETAITLIQDKGTLQLKVTFSPDDVTDKTVLWSSSDTLVVVVDSLGLVTARKSGKATITATAASNLEAKATCEVTVIQPVESITLNETSIIMEEFGNMVKLNATILPEDASDKSVRWSSSNPNVCTVTQNGTVVAVGNGTATVIATTVDGDIPATCVVNVKDYVYDTNRDGAIDVADIAAIISKMAAMARMQKEAEE